MRAEDLTIKLKAIDATKKAFTTVNKRLALLAKAAKVAAKGLAVITSAAVGVGAILAKVFRSNAPYLDALAKTSQKFGLATEDIQAYRDAAELAGIGNAKLDTSLQRFIRRLGEAANGTGQTAKEFKKLGLSAEALKLEGPDKAFETVLDKIQSIPDATERVRLAFAFFGKEGVDLVRLTSDAIRESRERMERLNLSVSSLDAAKVEAANDSLKILRDVLASITQRLTIQMSGAITVVSDRISEAIGRMNLFGSANLDMSRVALTVLGKIMNAWDMLRAFIDFNIANVKLIQIAFLQLGKSIAEVFDDKVLGLLSNLPGQLGETARAFREAGGFADKFADKIAGLSAERTAIFNSINDRLQTDNVEELLAELEAIEAQQQKLIATRNAANAALAAGTAATKDHGAATDDNTTKTNHFADAMSNLGSAFGAFGRAATAGGTRAFRAFQRIQIALSTVAALSTAIRAASETVGGPFARLAAYAKVAATLLAGVAQIRAVNVGGGSTATPAPSGSSFTPTVDTTSTNTAQSNNFANDDEDGGEINIQLSGGGILGEEILRELVDQLNRRGLSRKLRTS